MMHIEFASNLPSMEATLQIGVFSPPKQNLKDTNGVSVFESIIWSLQSSRLSGVSKIVVPLSESPDPVYRPHLNV